MARHNNNRYAAIGRFARFYWRERERVTNIRFILLRVISPRLVGAPNESREGARTHGSNGRECRPATMCKIIKRREPGAGRKTRAAVFRDANCVRYGRKINARATRRFSRADFVPTTGRCSFLL